MPGFERSLPAVNVYVDGYNFYRPIQKKAEQSRDQRILRLAWCDYCKLSSLLAARLFGPHTLGAVKLFTAYARDDVRRAMSPQGLKRKQLWLEALHLATGGRIHISFGRWEWKPDGPQHTKEKLTDVKLAISLVRDGLLPVRHSQNVPQWSYDPDHLYADDDPAWPFDKAIVVSCDKDFLPAAEMVARDTGKALAVAFPYLSTPYLLPPASPIGATTITEEDLRASCLPDTILRGDGTKIAWDEYVLSKGWKIGKSQGA